MIIDDTAYFEPYLFGQDPSPSTKNLNSGGHMPVFKLQLKSDGVIFKIFVEHFIKLWLTANIDLFHAEARIAYRDYYIKNVFDLHSRWFKQVYSVMNASRDNGSCDVDRRKFPRQPWELNQPTLNFYLNNSKKNIASKFIFDYSRNGIAVRIEETSGIDKGQILCLQDSASTELLQTNLILNHFLKMKSFMIKRIANESQSKVGLQTISETEIN